MVKEKDLCDIVKQKDIVVHLEALANNFSEVLRYMGIVLLVLGGFAAAALLVLAVVSPERLSRVSKTLWGLFFINLVMGLVLLSFVKKD